MNYSLEEVQQAAIRKAIRTGEIVVIEDLSNSRAVEDLMREDREASDPATQEATYPAWALLFVLAILIIVGLVGYFLFATEVSS